MRTVVVGGIAAAGLTAIVLIPSAASAASNDTNTTSAPTPTAQQAACDRGPWGLRVEGAPKDFSAGDRGGDYLWHDATGFHLRVTHKNDNRIVYTGDIVSPTPMRIDPVKLEKGDVAQLSADHRTLTFAFADYGHIDGVDFHTDCAPNITVTDLNAGNNRLPTDRVYLGRYELNPANIPFTVHRLDAR